jgi:hypothetical protein
MGPNIITRSKLNFDPAAPPGGQETDILAEDYSWDSTYNPDPELEDYNVTPADLWGSNNETGMGEHPDWGADSPDHVSRDHVQNQTGDPWPPWGGSRKPSPAGNFIRAIRHGSRLMVAARVLPNEDVAQGWTNKTHGIAGDALPADDSQVFMQTSMIQRYKVRAGSQRSGSQSDFSAPIESRVTGQKVKNWTDEQSARHWDMLPYEQEDYIRPFLSRQAGTGWREWNYPNEMYVSPVIQREPAPDPELGPVAGSQDYGQPANSTDYGYSPEDGAW